MQRCLSTHGCTAACSMPRSTPLCRRSILDERGPVQEDRSSQTGPGLAMCSIIAEVHQQQPQVSHEGLKDGGMELASYLPAPPSVARFRPPPLTLAAAIQHCSDATSVIPVACFPVHIFHRVKQWPFDPTMRSPSSNVDEGTF